MLVDLDRAIADSNPEAVTSSVDMYIFIPFFYIQHYYYLHYIVHVLLILLGGLLLPIILTFPLCLFLLSSGKFFETTFHQILFIDFILHFPFYKTYKHCAAAEKDEKLFFLHLDTFF